MTRHPAPALLVGAAMALIGCTAGVPPAGHREAPASEAAPATAPMAIEPAADDPTALRGPDGVLYPDWRRAGVAGGIPSLPVAVTVAECGGIPDDGCDDSPAIRSALQRAAAAGGGAVLLGPGTWHLDQPIAIDRDGIVLRGSGRDATILAVRHGEPAAGTLRFVAPDDGAIAGSGSLVEVHANPDRLTRLAIAIDGVEVAAAEGDRSGGGAGWIVAPWRQLAAGAGIAAGARTLVATATWEGGRSATVSRQAIWDPQLTAPAGGWPQADGRQAIHLCGRSDGERVALVADARRGGRMVRLARPIPDLSVGDVVQLAAPATERFRAEIGSRLDGARAQRLLRDVVAAVDGAQVTLDAPLRIDLPLADGPTLMRCRPVRRSGVESLTLRQEVRSYTNAIALQDAFQCWVRDVRIVKAGRHPVFVNKALRCELRELDLDDAWYKDGGGTAYLGVEFSTDCLVDGARAQRLRHAPNLQWSSFGNVLRRIDADGTDIQWHAGFTADNLVELCTIRSHRGRGGKTYGYGVFASGPDCLSHGPQGPRNVVWGCDVASDLDAIMLRGGDACRGWIFAYNRFRITGQGPALFLQLGGGGHLLLGNRIATRDPVGLHDYWAKGAARAPYNAAGAAVWFHRGSRIDGETSFPHRAVEGVRLVGNDLMGFRCLAAGDGDLGGADGNRLLPAGAPCERPVPPVPSIFLWQRGIR